MKATSLTTTALIARGARLALAASILTAAQGCDKASRAASAATVADVSDAPVVPEAAVAATSTDTTDLARRPHILYQVFGERDDPRLFPVAALMDGQIRPLVLSPAGWQRFDSLYHDPGTRYTIYQDGREAGWARITRPMWDADAGPLYTLPRCRSLTPLAAAQVKAPPPVGYLVEHIATDAPITPPRRAARRGGSGEGRLNEARKIATAVAEAAGMDSRTIAALDFRAVAVNAGATDDPTLVVSLIDPSAGMSENGNASHVFVLADRVDGHFVPTYTRIVRGGSGRTDYRRYVDHLDLTGDGVDELVVEGWSSGHESYMLVLQFERGRWVEVFQGRPSWCLDR